MDERSVPGTDPKFDGLFSAWLRDSSVRELIRPSAEDLFR